MFRAASHSETPIDMSQQQARAGWVYQKEKPQKETMLWSSAHMSRISASIPEFMGCLNLRLLVESLRIELRSSLDKALSLHGL